MAVSDLYFQRAISNILTRVKAAEDAQAAAGSAAAVTNAAVAANAAAAAPVGLSWVESCGHSIAGGGGARIVPHGGYPYLVKRALGIDNIHDYAVGGAVACRPTSVGTGDGGYAWVLRNLYRPGQSGVTATPGAPYNPQSQLVICHFGLNDMGVLGANKPLPWQTALRTILAGFCSTANFIYSDASWAFTGTWPTLGITDAQASTSDLLGIKYTTTANGVATWTVPADAPTGRVCHVRLWISAAWASSTYGVRVNRSGSWTSLPDLTITPSQITDQTVANMHNLHTLRFGSGVAGDPYGTINLGPGDKIELTLKSGAGLAVDGAGIESDPLDGPIFAAPLPHKPATYGIWSGWAGGSTMNDAAIDSWKVYERAILAEFPGRVITDPKDGQLGIDLDHSGINRYNNSPGTAPPPVAGTPVDYVFDGAHPNDRGHAILAQYVAKAVRNSPLITDRVRSRPFVDPRPRAWRKSSSFTYGHAGQLRTDIGVANFGNAAFPDFMWRYDQNRRVRVRGLLKVSASFTGTDLTFTNAYPQPQYVVGKQMQVYDGVSAYSFRQLRMSAQKLGFVGAALPTAANSFLEIDFEYEGEK